MFTEPMIDDERNQVLRNDNFHIEIDVWINKITKKKHIMAYIYPIGTFIGDDLWAGFKFSYHDVDDYEGFLNKLMVSYKKSIALNKRKGTLVLSETL